MTALFIVIAVVIFLFLVLIVPVSFRFMFDEEIKWSLYVLGIRVIRSDKAEKETEEPPQKKSTEESAPKSKKIKDYFMKLKNEKGFSGAVKYCADIAGIILRKLLWYVKTLKFRKFLLEITVASEDAAKTGIEYGAVCAAVYPVVSFLETNADFKSKSITVNADFDTVTPGIRLDIAVRTMPLTAIIAAVSGLIEYRKFKKESEVN